jgi:hypothetical protein
VYLGGDKFSESEARELAAALIEAADEIAAWSRWEPRK